MVIVMIFLVYNSSLIKDASLSIKKPGCLGCGKIASSFANMKTTEDIVGLSPGSFWTHSKPT